MKSLEEHFEDFQKNNAIALGIGVDSVPSNKEWAKSMELKKTQLLSDFWPHGEVSKAYGVFIEKDGFSERATILIDGNGNVTFTKLYPMGELPDIHEILKLIKS